ncbi:MAG: hypothetical protein BroJett040_11120 [Oligoflexia bacterium]|nr:MAG: hypothetical protein BroJett040_11120 [Oligoflexia bacterium]
MEKSDKTINRKILIVDDNTSIHEDFKKVLGQDHSELDTELSKLEDQLFGTSTEKIQKVQYELDSAFQGSQAIDMIRSAFNAGQPYAVVFLDVRMPPGFDGVHTAKKIWEIAPDTQIVLCSAFMDYSHEDLISKLGITDNLIFMRKPFDSVAVNQVALSLTTKWGLRKKVQQYIDDLEDLVKHKSMMLLESSKMAALGHMAGGVAHEINTPLCVIQLQSEKLQKMINQGNFDPAKFTESTGKILALTDRIAGIIKGLRTFSREASDDPFVKVPLKAILEDTLLLSAEKLKLGEIKVDYSLVTDECKLKCRHTQMSQLFLNLIANSYDAIINLPEKWIKITCTRKGNNAYIEFMDSGKGIPQNIQTRIFDPFFTTKEVGKGTGLGLSVARGIVESHGGSINIDPTKENTCFVVQIPLSE